VFSNNVVDDAGDSGVYLSISHSSEISFNSISNIGEWGLYVEVCDDLIVDSNSIQHTAENGVRMVASNRPTITSLNTLDTDPGLHAEACHNGTITESRFEDSGEAIGVLNSDNWLIADNTIVEAGGNGIEVQNGPNAAVLRNSISVVSGNDAIRIDTCPDAMVVNNTISEVDNLAISVFDAQRILIDGNIITSCDYGIFADISDNITVSANTIADSLLFGILLNTLDNPTVSFNSITATYGRGISVSTVLLGVFENNTMTDCGFYFTHGLAFQYYNHTLTGNTANGKPVLYEQNLNNADLTADDYGQIILLNCTFIEIANGSFTKATNPVQLFSCEEVLVESLTLELNFRAMTINASDNVTIRKVTVVGGEDGYSGIYMHFSDRTYIDNITVSDCNGNSNYGVMFQTSYYGTVTDSVFTNNYFGIRWSSSDNITVTNCDIFNSESYGIYAWGSTTDYSLVEGNTILNASRGFYSNQANDGLVTNNVIMYCSNAAIYLGGSVGDNYNITLNTVENNYDGIVGWTSDYHFIMNNTIRWNSNYGTYLLGSDFTEVYYNLIALNGLNGGDSRAGNFWDDGVALGNWWDDYIPPGIYNVDGSGGNTDDRWPQQYAPTEPIINQPQDFAYAEGSTGNEVVWRVFDDSLKDWEVWIDGALWEADAWDFVDITINVDGLSYGTHNVEVIVWDTDYNNVTDTLVIDVFDGTRPTINSPANRVAFVDGTGQTLVWVVADLHPGSYVVTLDDDEYETGVWIAGSIGVSIDGLDEGEHLIVMTVYDIDRNSASGGVLILVVDDVDAPTIDEPEDITYYFGTTGNRIIWSPEDEYPASYEVSLNGTVIISESWQGSRIVVEVDGTPIGTHHYVLTVYDGSGDSASDTVTVNVLPVVPATTAIPPPDYSVLIILVVGAGIAAVVIVVLFLYLKKSRT
jgi:parallel beta-helix repeat protein